MSKYNRGDILLVPFVSTGDSMPSKQRPVAVLAEIDLSDGNSELVVAQITGNFNSQPRRGDYTLARWQDSGLLRPSLIRGRITTLHSTSVIRQLGSLHKDDLQKMLAAIGSLMGLSTTT
ncbi:type II toxin-antitoxin system PemK/MazF family toxin [SAR202 cluster bacterium AC-409-J13_OGT_754m]|nr:type II toxin-antitoxin system PemK/MazF family toxin [SAR202 cluster bacterium AC-409-J13_OGT_754m]